MERDKEILDINIEEIIPNRFQPRLSFEPESLKELSESIKQHGIFQPLVVRPIGNKYEIIAGERRYKAATMAGFKMVPCVVINLDDNESAEIALVENLQRKDLTPIEEAKSYKKLLDRGYVTQEQLAKRMGKSQPAIANKIRLLNLSEDVQQALLESRISERHARSLLSIKDPEQQVKMLNEIITKRLTVRDTDMEVKKMINENAAVMPDFIPIREEVKPTVQEEINIEPTISLENLAKAETPIIPIQPTVPTPEAPKSNEETYVDIDKLTKATQDITPIAKPDIIELLRIEEIPQQIEAAPVVAPIIPEVQLPIEPEIIEEIPTISVEEIPTVMEQPIASITSETPEIMPIVPEEPIVAPIISEAPIVVEQKEEIAIPMIEETQEIPVIGQITPQPFVFENPQKPIPVEPEIIQPEVKPLTATYVTNNLRTAINTTRDCVSTLEKFGFSVDKEEMDLTDSYQIIIKIHKTDV